MIIPLIFTLDPVYENLSQTWVFYKAVSFCKKYGWPVIAQEQYFTEWEKQNRIFPQFFQQDLCDMFEYDVPKKADLYEIEPIIIPKKIEQNFITEKHTQSDAYVATFREDWQEMEDFLCDALQNVMDKSEEKIEAITCLTYVKFLDNVSKRLNISVIYYEWGPFRYSSYRNTAFFDINGAYKHVRAMFEDFKQCDGFKNVPVLSTREILALLLKENYLKYVTENTTDLSDYNKYEMGIIGGYNSLVETSAYTYLNMVELYNSALKIFSESEVAVRYHPGDPIHAHLNVPNEKTGELIDFILSCKRVACISSNVEVEAMLYGKKVYDTGVFKYEGIVNNDISGLEDREPTIEEINFIVFVSITPFEFLNSVEYLRFRLSNPDIKEIYLYHLRYYLDNFQISYEKFEKEAENRLGLILESRNAISNVQELPKQWKDMSESKLYQLLQQQKNAKDRLRAELMEMQNLKEELGKELGKIQEELGKTQEERAEILQKSQRAREELNLRIEELERVMRESNERAGRELQQCQFESEQRRLENERLHEAYDAILNSRTMKLTKPLRAIFGRKNRNED